MSGPTVAYILGTGRSGSTLLGRLLGQAEGCCDVGELAGLWRVRRFPGWRCGCGRVLTDCPLWAEVLAAPAPAGGRLGDLDPAAMAAGRRRQWRTRHVPGLWWAAARRRPAAPGYGAVLEALYGALARAAGASVVVDSSKFPAEPVVAAARGLDVRVVHLVRDPRAVAHSWSRPRPRPGGLGDGTMRRRAPLACGLEWSALHALGAGAVRDAVGPARYRRLRYEDLAADPRGACADLLGFLGRPGPVPGFAGAATVDLEPSHTVTGNPSRFSVGAVDIVADDEWRHAMAPRDRRLATAGALPLLGPMGYPVRAASPRSSCRAR